MKHIKKIYPYLFIFWKREVLILFLGVLSICLGLVNPYLTKLIIDKAYLNKDLKLFVILVAAGALIFILTAIFTGLNNYLNRYIKLRISFDLNRKIFKRLQNLSYGFFQNSSAGEHLYKIGFDIEQVSRFIADILPQGFTLIPKTILILAVLFYLNFKIALLTLLATPFFYLASYYFNKRIKAGFRAWLENSQSVFKKLSEVLSRIYLIKAFGEEKRETRDHIKRLTGNVRFGLGNINLETQVRFASGLINRIILGGILFYGGYQIIAGRMTLGSLSAIAIYLTQLSGLQGQFTQFFHGISLGLVSYERLERILEAEPQSGQIKDAKEFVFPKGRIEFRGVSFGYVPQKLVFEDLNFCIPGGAYIALIGSSGCGKTTLVNLILRLFKPQKGAILIDGYNVDNIKSGSLYAQVGVVLQEPYLWNDTIENNIRYARADAPFKEIQEAAKIAGIDDFINGLTHGYHTVIGENACKISEGQKQRIAIARAIIKRPKILILDEALSCVDVELESRIARDIRNFLSGSTIIVISHRHSAISRAEAVYSISSPGTVSVYPYLPRAVLTETSPIVIES